MFTIAPGEDTERAVAVRNPYYWKVDTEGTQLPISTASTTRWSAIPRCFF
nr:hypothetical protein [Marinicella sp. W31]MDC2875443.1 hypothetical protein [Marinicella sp. W31]